MSRIPVAATAAALAATAVSTALPSSAHAATAPPPVMVVTSDRDGDTEIYLRKTDGSLTQLTRNRAEDYGAVWSPDGRKLAFVSTRDGDREIFTMNADGSGLRQLTRNSKAANGSPVSDQAPAWSPDGQRIAFSSTRDGGEPEIYRMNADGTSPVRLTRTAAYVSDSTPAWSPGGHYILFSSDRVNFENYEIYRMRSNGTEVTRLTRTANGVDENSPEYSPDGRRIVFSSNRTGQHDLYTMATNGTGTRRLTGASGLDDVFPRWTSDGSQVVYETFERPGVASRDDVWVVDSDGTDARRVLSTSARETFPDPRPVRR